MADQTGRRGRSGPRTAKQGAALRKNQRAAVAWDETHGEAPDPARYRAEIEPGLLGQPISAITAATGLSKAYASRIRRGQVVPHARHWEKLEKLAAALTVSDGGVAPC
jgi:hypothetical protein